MPDNGTLSPQVAIVTASGRGMGKAIAKRLAGAGARVVICARTLSYGEQTVKELSAAGHDARLFGLDVTDHQAIVNLMAFTQKEFGRIDIVVHCAADIPFASLSQITDVELDRTFTSIVKSSFWLLQAAAPVMKSASGGAFVFISSTAGNQYVIPGLVHYGAAKSALNAIVRGAAIELARDGIRVNGIEPGLIASDRMKESMPPEVAQLLAGQLPIPRAGTPEEIAGLVHYLVSADAAYINGANIVMDGGSSLPNPVDIGRILREHNPG